MGARGDRGGALVANPGCYPTATLLALLPLGMIGTPRQVIVDAKSGITGAGRRPRVESLFAEVSGEIRAYGLDGHRHQPEIERALRRGGIPASVIFTPHVVPIARGMLVDAYAIFDDALDAGAVTAAYEFAYAGSPFVRVLSGGRAPSIAAVVGTNDAELRVDVRGASCARSARSTISARARPGRPFRISTSCWDSRRRAGLAIASSSLELIALRGGLGGVPGVRLAGVHAGIKPRKRDLALVLFDTPQSCASVVTTNEIKAAPLLVSAEHLALAPRCARSSAIRAARTRARENAASATRARPRGKRRRCSICCPRRSSLPRRA